VQRASERAPEGFETAVRVATGDTLYPGLIELHNHLAYNAVPLWRVPKRYQHNASWRGTEEATRAVSKPAEVLARTPGVVEAMVRYAEVRCLLGGVTTSQGITLASDAGIQGFFKGLVRNVEQSLVDGLPNADTRIENPPTNGAAGYLEDLETMTCRLQHMSEGFGETARGWFLRLRFPSHRKWAINGAFCAIHATALTRADFDAIRRRGGSMVWSPLSNYLLYGATADVDALKASGLLIGLGSDWSPTGSKNLIGELKVARIASREAGDVFSPEELVAMVTANPARICKWESQLGSLEPGKLADIVAVNGTRGDPYELLLNARESSITLVMIDGVPRVGQVSAMERFEPIGQRERLTVGGAVRLLDLAPVAGVDPLGGITVADTTHRLREALADLPTLAADLDSGITTQGFVSDAGDVLGGDDGRGVEGGGTTRWWVKLDFEAEDTASAEDHGLDVGASLAEWVEPMAFEELTVVDDPGFLPAIVHALNVPRFVKEQLPAAYGLRLAVPDEAAVRDLDDDVRAELGETGDLAAFLATAAGQLSRDDRATILDQASAVLERHYVHLPFKRARYAIDPLQRLRILRRELDEAGDQLPPELDFHGDLLETFGLLRDLHTTYQLPFPFRSRVAWLPFLIEECIDAGTTRYLVTRLVGDPGPDSFTVGAEILHWNGTPIDAAVRQLARSEPGSNPAARHARAVSTLTTRPLSYMIPPAEEWVTLRYRPPSSGQTRELRHRWLVSTPRRGVGRIELDSLGVGATQVGVDGRLDELNDIRKVFFAGDALHEERRARSQGHAKRVALREGEIATSLPTVLRARPVEVAGERRYGYLRIFSFNVADADDFADECEHLLDELPPHGLIIDVRGNGGGSIIAAETLLELLSPEPVSPETAEFIATPPNLTLCRTPPDPQRFSGLRLTPWEASLNSAIGIGAPYSLAFPITDPDHLHTRSQIYQGPKLLIVDPLCYSATDIFAAGFADHAVGPILGVGATTGAGGANVWSQRVLRALLSADGPDQAAAYQPLPYGSDLRVAVRRTLRVGQRAGEIVEDFGVTPDHVTALTARDVLGSNEDLLATAIDILAAQPDRALTLEVERPGGRGRRRPVLVVRGTGVERVDVTVNGWHLRSCPIADDAVRIDLADYQGPAADTLDVELLGTSEGRAVTRRRQQVAVAGAARTSGR
jgi:cytosine/adenosine deaminase-related metal-dependent hydrolase